MNALEALQCNHGLNNAADRVMNVHLHNLVAGSLARVGHGDGDLRLAGACYLLPVGGWFADFKRCVAQSETEREERSIWIQNVTAAGSRSFVVVDRKLADVAGYRNREMA